MGCCNQWFKHLRIVCGNMHKIDVDKLLGKNPSRRKKILLEFAKQPSGVANKVLAETLHIDHSDLVNQHLSAFEEFGVIRKCDVVVKRPMGRVRTPTDISMKGCRLNHDTNALHKLVAAFNHDPDSQHEFMRSQYYRGMTSDLVHQFVDSIPDNDLWMLDTYKHTATRDQPLSNGDVAFLTEMLTLRVNWLALKFVTRFISVDSDERSRTLRQLIETASNPVISPTAARNAGEKRGFCLGMDKCLPWIRDDAALKYRKERIEAEMNNAPFDKRINWTVLFAQLHHFNSNYRYLFD